MDKLLYLIIFDCLLQIQCNRVVWCVHGVWCFSMIHTLFIYIFFGSRFQTIN